MDEGSSLSLDGIPNHLDQNQARLIEGLRYESSDEQEAPPPKRAFAQVKDDPEADSNFSEESADNDDEEYQPTKPKKSRAAAKQNLNPSQSQDHCYEANSEASNYRSDNDGNDAFD